MSHSRRAIRRALRHVNRVSNERSLPVVKPLALRVFHYYRDTHWLRSVSLLSKEVAPYRGGSTRAGATAF